jgi:hypothetical protein
MAVNWHEVFPVTSASATDIHREKNENGNTATSTRTQTHSTNSHQDHAHTKMYAEGIVADYTGAATKNCAPV